MNYWPLQFLIPSHLNRRVSSTDQNCSANAITPPDHDCEDRNGRRIKRLVHLEAPFHYTASLRHSTDSESRNINQLHQRKTHDIAQPDVLCILLGACGI